MDFSLLIDLYFSISFQTNIDHQTSRKEHQETVYGRGYGKFRTSQQNHCYGDGQRPVLNARFNGNGEGPLVGNPEQPGRKITHHHGGHIQ